MVLSGDFHIPTRIVWLLSPVTKSRTDVGVYLIPVCPFKITNNSRKINNDQYKIAVFIPVLCSCGEVEIVVFICETEVEIGRPKTNGIVTRVL